MSLNSGRANEGHVSDTSQARYHQWQVQWPITDSRSTLWQPLAWLWWTLIRITWEQLTLHNHICKKLQFPFRPNQVQPHHAEEIMARYKCGQDDLQSNQFFFFLYLIFCDFWQWALIKACGQSDWKNMKLLGRSGVS